MASVAGLVVSSVTDVSRLITVTSGTGGTSIALLPPWVWVALIGLDAALGVTEILLFRSAFRRLADVDRTFSTPATFALLACIGVLLALVGVGLLLDALYHAVQCAGSGVPIPSSCLLTGTFWGGVGLAGIGAIVAVIGFLGILLGIWRLGTRFGDTKFKVGAILLIFPLLNILGAILILLGAREAVGKIERPSTFPVPPG